MKLIATQDFSWAHRGCDVEHFKNGQEIETDDADLVRVAVEQEKWAKKAPDNKGQKNAPENK